MIDTSGVATLVTGDLDAVVGLMAPTTLGDVRGVLDISAVRTATNRLGTERREVDSYSATLPDSPLCFAGGIWVYAVGEHVVLIAGRDPHPSDDHDGGGEQVAAPDLGEPATRLDAAIGTLMIPDSELVYPAKGVALRVDPDDGQLMAVLLFEPTTVDDYVRRVRPSAEPWRRLGFTMRENWL